MTKAHTRRLWGNICGSASIGERGQIVIPKKARDLMNIKTGDQFLTLEHNGSLVLVPEKTMAKMLKDITKILLKK